MFLTKLRAQLGAESPRHRRRIVCVATTALALVAVAGCSSDGGVDTEVPLAASTQASPSATPTSASDEDAILAAYREFFARQAEISLAPKEQRRVLLEPFTTDPALNRVLRGMFAAEEFGEVGYGGPVVDPSVESIDGDTATIVDCQDGENAGRKKRSNGKITTRGMEDTKVVATAERGPDDRWRMATFDYPDESC